MALDGVLLSCLRAELQSTAVGCRIEKIYQPTRDELVLSISRKGFAGKLLLSIASTGPRLHFTTESYENPAVPPMFCMLMRKFFIGAKLTGVTQYGFERVLDLQFDSYDEMGDPIILHIIMEILGRQSNVILCRGERIIDAIRRSEPTAERLILPGGVYSLPTGQGKRSVLEDSADQLAQSILERGGQLFAAVMDTLDGVSPAVAREVADKAVGDTSARCEQCDSAKLAAAIEHLRLAINNPRPCMISLDGKPTEFSYMPLAQYGKSAEITVCDSFSSLLEQFYANRRHNQYFTNRTQDTARAVRVATERIVRKMQKQRAELAECAEREQLRIYGELLKANISLITAGAGFADVPNYYDPDYKSVRIPLNPALSPSQNAQRYFKDYKRTYTAEQKLTALLKDESDELLYLESVADMLSRVQSERELSEIREELAEGGYIRTVKTQSKRSQKSMPPLHFMSDDGFDIYVGRNNRQNDLLSVRTAERTDIWLHTKAVHGSHTVIATGGTTVPERTVQQAAMLAAYHSKARQSSGVAVDYCPVRNVRKPSGARPGMVIYDNYNTVYVTPDSAEVERLADLSRKIQ